MARKKKKFLYFTYCVNMLSSRMECCVDKSVVMRGPAKLCGFRLLFVSFSEDWKGCLPNIVKSYGDDDVVWGTLWELEEGLRARLDLLQGKDYVRTQVEVRALRIKGSLVTALSYQLGRITSAVFYKHLEPWTKGRPSKLYLEEMVRGAEESGVPSYYRKWLRAHPHNGFPPHAKSWSWVCLPTGASEMNHH